MEDLPALSIDSTFKSLGDSLIGAINFKRINFDKKDRIWILQKYFNNPHEVIHINEIDFLENVIENYLKDENIYNHLTDLQKNKFNEILNYISIRNKHLLRIMTIMDDSAEYCPESTQIIIAAIKYIILNGNVLYNIYDTDILNQIETYITQQNTIIAENKLTQEMNILKQLITQRIDEINQLIATLQKINSHTIAETAISSFFKESFSIESINTDKYVYIPHNHHINIKNLTSISNIINLYCTNPTFADNIRKEIYDRQKKNLSALADQIFNYINEYNISFAELDQKTIAQYLATNIFIEQNFKNGFDISLALPNNVFINFEDNEKMKRLHMETKKLPASLCNCENIKTNKDKTYNFIKKIMTKLFKINGDAIVKNLFDLNENNFYYEHYNIVVCVLCYYMVKCEKYKMNSIINLYTVHRQYMSNYVSSFLHDYGYTAQNITLTMEITDELYDLIKQYITEIEYKCNIIYEGTIEKVEDIFNPETNIGIPENMIINYDKINIFLAINKMKLDNIINNIIQRDNVLLYMIQKMQLHYTLLMPYFNGQDNLLDNELKISADIIKIKIHHIKLSIDNFQPIETYMDNASACSYLKCIMPFEHYNSVIPLFMKIMTNGEIIPSLNFKDAMHLIEMFYIYQKLLYLKSEYIYKVIESLYSVMFQNVYYYIVNKIQSSITKEELMIMYNHVAAVKHLSEIEKADGSRNIIPFSNKYNVEINLIPNTQIMENMPIYKHILLFCYKL